MWKFISQFIHEHAKEFWRGFIGGGVPVGTWIFSKPDLLNAFWVAFLLKASITVVWAATSGFLYTLGVDYYNHKWKKKLFPKNKNGKDNAKDEAA